MVSGKPPRHSRPKNDPVTIDLEAREEKPEAQADAPVEEGLVEPAASAEAAPITEPEAAESRTISEVAEEQPTNPEPETVLGQAEPAFGTSEDEPKPEPETATTAPPSPAIPSQKSPAFASLAAVGILGGLIALAGAGALQYGGVLPGLGANNTPSSDTSLVSSEIAALKAEVSRLATLGPSSSDGALEQRVADLEAAGGGQPGATTAEMDALKAALTQSTQDIAALKAELASVRQSQTDSASAIETRLTQAETKLDEPRRDVSMAHAIAVAALKTAIDRGGPFLGELNTLQGINAEDPAVVALQPFAATGVASRAELTRRFPAVADAILAAINQPASGQSWSDRLMSSAMSVVKVRPVGNVEGDAPEAIVARMEDKLHNGDLKGASLEWETLPEAGKVVSVDFRKTLQTRIDVENTVSTALTNAVDGQG